MIKPTKDKILIELVKTKSTSNSGIVLPDNYKEETSLIKGRVIELGANCKDLGIEEKDVILIKKYSYDIIEYDNKEYAVCDYKEVIAIVDDSDNVPIIKDDFEKDTLQPLNKDGSKNDKFNKAFGKPKENYDKQ